MNKHRLRLKKPKTKQIFVRENGLLKPKNIRIGVLNPEFD